MSLKNGSPSRSFSSARGEGARRRSHKDENELAFARVARAFRSVPSPKGASLSSYPPKPRGEGSAGATHFADDLATHCDAFPEAGA